MTTPVQTFELVILLLGLVIPLELAARRLRLPPAAALIVGGMALALVPGRHELQIDPDLTLVLFLPPLLLSGAYFTVWREFRANLAIILNMAVGAVAFTTFAVGVATHWAMPGLPWAACFTLGAIVSPPDAVAAKAVLQRVRLPPRMTVLLEGESLVNDASGLVLFRMATAAALTGTFSAGQAVASFGMLAVGGLAFGWAFGHAAAALFARLRDSTLMIVGSLLAAWASYAVGEAIGVSGVLSTVACGLVLGRKQHAILSAVARTNSGAVWSVVVFVLESLVFVLIGLSLRGILERLGGTWGDVWRLAPALLTVVAAVIVARFVWIFPSVYLPRLVWPALRARGTVPVAVPLVMSWAGMRGVVSLAIALSLPTGMPGRDFMLAATFLVIVVTVLGQGATLAPLILWLRLDRFAARQVQEGAQAFLGVDEARAVMAQVQAERVGLAASGPDGTVLHPRLVEQYTFRADAARRYSENAEQLLERRQAHYDVVLAAVEAGRAELLRLHRSGRIADGVMGLLEEELDLEDITAQRMRGAAE